MKVAARFGLLMLLGLAAAAPAPAQTEAGRDALNLGVQAFRTGRFEAAVGHFTRAKQLDPSLTNAELYLATAYARQYVPNVASAENDELAKKAIALFETVLIREPQNVEALSELAGIYQSTLDYSRARDIYLRLTRIEPQNPVNFYNAGSTNWILAYDKQNPLPAANRVRVIDEGLENLAAALRLNPLYDEAMTYTNLLLRQKALVTTPIESARLLNEADQWFQNALATRSLNRPAAGRGIAGGAPTPPPPPPPPPLPPSLVRSQAVGVTQIGADEAQRNLISKVEPKYPPAVLAAARLEASVAMQTTIDRIGGVVDVKVLSGHPLLNDAVIEAVKQWKYKPYLMNGQPIDVTTTVVVSFPTR